MLRDRRIRYHWRCGVCVEDGRIILDQKTVVVLLWLAREEGCGSNGMEVWLASSAEGKLVHLGSVANGNGVGGSRRLDRLRSPSSKYSIFCSFLEVHLDLFLEKGWKSLKSSSLMHSVPVVTASAVSENGWEETRFTKKVAVVLR